MISLENPAMYLTKLGWQLRKRLVGVSQQLRQLPKGT